MDNTTQLTGIHYNANHNFLQVELDDDIDFALTPEFTYYGYITFASTYITFKLYELEEHAFVLPINTTHPTGSKLRLVKNIKIKDLDKYLTVQYEQD